MVNFTTPLAPAAPEALSLTSFRGLCLLFSICPPSSPFPPTAGGAAPEATITSSSGAVAAASSLISNFEGMNRLGLGRARMGTGSSSSFPCTPRPFCCWRSPATSVPIALVVPLLGAAAARWSACEPLQLLLLLRRVGRAPLPPGFCWDASHASRI